MEKNELEQLELTIKSKTRHETIVVPKEKIAEFEKFLENLNENLSSKHCTGKTENIMGQNQVGNNPNNKGKTIS